jgi:hypothetical protein
MIIKQKFLLTLPLLFFLSIFSTNAENVEEELRQLAELKEIGAISDEEYQFLYSSLTDEEEENGLYTLVINKKKLNGYYKTISSEGKIFFPFFAFFNSLGHTYMHKTEDRIHIFLENDQDMVDINLLANEIVDRNKNTIGIVAGSDYLQEDEDIFLESSLFEKLFLEKLDLDENTLEIQMIPSFTTNIEQIRSHEIELEKFNDKKEIEEITYTNKRKFFELGYLRTDLEWINEPSNSPNWNGELEYQGAFLFGKVTTGYDIRNQEWNDTSLRYIDIWNKHSLEFWRYNSKEKGFSFRKNKGYYWDGKRYIIREEVPIGSTVELIYMGAVVDIKHADNAEVIFDNSEIRENTTYTLKIYTPQGEILLRSIQTLKNFNQQKKNEIEYNIDIRERRINNKYNATIETFYGLTEFLTLGFDYMRSPELTSDNKWKYLEESQLELIYSNKLKDYPYVLSFGYGKAFTLYPDKTSYDLLAEIDIRDWSFSTELEKFGHYYDSKFTKNFEITYNPNNFYSIGYEFFQQENYENKIVSENRLKLSLNYSYKHFLTTLNLNTSTLNKKNEFDLNFYYNGFESFSIIFNNSWEDLSKNYEAKLLIASKQYYGPFDFNFELHYSETNKERIAFKFEVKFDDWFKITTSGNKKGDISIGLGIDKTTDLRDIRRSIESLDTSRVKVITFIDKNGNSLPDEDEERVEDVTIKLGSQTLTTDKNGEVYFYGVPNNIRYKIDVEPIKPTQTIGKVKYSVLGKDNSTIEALIPIKNYYDLNGSIILDPELNLDENEMEQIFSDITIEIWNNYNKLLEMAGVDEVGDFIVNGLLDKECVLSIRYNGQDYQSERFREKITITEKPFILNFNGKNFILEEAENDN